MQRDTSGLTLAQQIAQLETTVPTDFDPEDLHAGNDDNRIATVNDGDVDMDIPDPGAGREHYLDMGPSALRKLHDNITDPKYDGVKTSRRQFQADHDGNEDEIEENVDDSDSGRSHKVDMPSIHRPSLSSASEDEEHSPVSDGTTKDDEASTRHQDQDSKVIPQQEEALVSSLQRIRVADKLKGKAVSRQIKVWESLVDARIRLQKCVTTANRMPRPELLTPYITAADGRVSARRFLTEALLLSEELHELRHTLLAKAGSEQPPRKRRRIDVDQENLDLESLVEESTAEMVAFDVQTHTYTLSTLQKWSSKVQAVAPSVLLPSSRTSFKSGPAHITSASELVEDALRDQNKAVKRTWGNLDPGTRIGGITREQNDEGDEETFEDRDFYQAMLRDVIELKGGKDGLDVADLYANSKKQKKKKKNIDTKASKGRKLRYEPHEKLQNFMVPIPVRGTWHEEQIDELFASLLGTGFEVTMPATNGLETTQREDEVMQGFRVFG